MGQGLLSILQSEYCLALEAPITPGAGVAQVLPKDHETPEYLMKLSWSTIWEFQEQLSQSWALEDNAVLRNLQTSMKEFTRKHWDLPPPAPHRPACRGSMFPVLPF